MCRVIVIGGPELVKSSHTVSEKVLVSPERVLLYQVHPGFPSKSPTARKSPNLSIGRAGSYESSYLKKPKDNIIGCVRGYSQPWYDGKSHEDVKTSSNTVVFF